MDMSGEPVSIHMRTDANNLVTTASTTHLPEQKGTIHMINQLRHEACSGAIDDLAHVVSADCLADCLTKASAKPDALIKAVETGTLPNVDKHPPFRELMKHKHKAYAVDDREYAQQFLNNDEPEAEPDPLIPWIVRNLDHAASITTFLCVPVRARIEQYLVIGNAVNDWYDS